MRVCSVCHRCYENAVTDCIEDGHPVLYETRVHDLEAIDGYRIERLLDLGNKAETYLARHLASSRSCFIRIHNATGEHRERFLHEAKILASLFHPGVGDVYESGELDTGEVFVVAEHIDGKTLRDLLMSGGPPDLLTTIVLVRQASEALHTIHLKGLIHRSVRPENIVVSTDVNGNRSARIQNIDLGGMIERSIVSDKFTIDSAIDSIRYFAPEQCSGEPVTPQTDVYSLGIVLYEMVAGRPPFDDSKASGLIEMHRNRRPPDIRIDDFELRMLITHTLTESLNKRPQNRQLSANAFARQLRHMEQLATHVSTPPPAIAVPTHTAKSASAVSVSSFAQPVPVYTERASSHVDPPITASMEKSPDSPATREEMNAAEVVSVRSDNRHESEPLFTLRMTENVEHATSSIPAVISPQVPQQSSILQRLSRLKVRRRKLHTKFESPAAQSIHASVVPQAKPFEEPRRSPRKIEWQTPDDDIPTMDDVIAALADAEKPIPEPQSVSPAEPIAASTAELLQISMTNKPVLETKAEAKPIPAEHKGLSNDIPVKPKQKQAQRGSTTKTRKPVPATFADADEITAVTARSKPIHINLDQPAQRRRPAPIRQVVPQPSNDIPFSLTLLGQQAPATVAPGPSFLAAYARSAPPATYRTAIVGCGLAAAIALFLFSGGNWNRLATLASVEPTAAKPESQERIVSETQQVKPTQTVKKPATYFENSQPKNSEVAAELPRPNPVKEAPSSSPAKARSAAAKESREFTVPAKERPAPRSVSVTDKRSSGKKQPDVQPKLDGSTRPRIVKIPGS